VVGLRRIDVGLRLFEECEGDDGGRNSLEAESWVVLFAAGWVVETEACHNMECLGSIAPDRDAYDGGATGALGSENEGQYNVIVG
jgi:hypothetical protein